MAAPAALCSNGARRKTYDRQAHCRSRALCALLRRSVCSFLPTGSPVRLPRRSARAPAIERTAEMLFVPPAQFLAIGTLPYRLALTPSKPQSSLPFFATRAVRMPPMPSGSRRELANSARAWPFEEARKLTARIERRRAAGKAAERILFETGYGPSGLPHIG